MNGIRQQAVVTARLALELVDAALAESERLGVPIAATVLDSATNLVAFVSADGVSPPFAEMSRRKAAAAVATQRATGWLPPEVALPFSLGTGNLVADLPGGLPLRLGGQLVGGLGISGGSFEQDAAIGTAALKAIGADSE